MIGGGNQRIWRRGQQSIQRYIRLAPFRPHSADDIKRFFLTPKLIGDQQLVVDSVVRQVPCGSAKESWAVRYRYTGINNVVVLAILQYALDYEVILNYARPADDVSDASAARSLLAYCAPSDEPMFSATAVPAAPQPQSAGIDENGLVRLYGFSYTPPAGWERSPIRSTMTQTGIGKTEIILWKRGNDSIFLSALDRSEKRIAPLDALQIRQTLMKRHDDVSAVPSNGCADRPIVIVEFKTMQRDFEDPFDKRASYVTQVWINGETNYANLEYRRSSPQADESFMRSINTLCFHPGSAIGLRQLPVERFALPVVEKRL